MGESDRYIDYNRRKLSLGDDRNSLTTLISINAVVFLIISFTRIIYFVMQSPPGSFENEVMTWFVMPAKLNTLSHHPWTILTAMFTHAGDGSIISVITNMLWLWAFGYIFQSVSGNRKLIPVYLYGGLAGAVIFIVSYYAMPPLRIGLPTAQLFGANASIMAVAVATTVLVPDYRIFRMLNGGIPLWVVTLLYVVVDFAGVSGTGSAYHLSHLAGGLSGFIFVFLLRKGIDITSWITNAYDRLINLFNPAKKEMPVKRIMREKVFYKTGNQKPFIKTSNITQQRIDEILDKINQKGYNLLSEEEKSILKRAGESDNL